jgi:hypothetical protein
MQKAVKKEEARHRKLPKSSSWRIQWSGWKVASEARTDTYFNMEFDAGLTVPVVEMGEGVPNFLAFILFNPSAELATDMHQMIKIWSSWVKPTIAIYVAVPIEAKGMFDDLDMKGVKVLVVPEKEAYPPVKLELAMWKQAYIDLHRDFTEKTFVIKLDMDTYFSPDALVKQTSTFAAIKDDYIGSRGYGRHSEYRAKPYCVGFSYFIRASHLAKFEDPGPLPPTVVNSDVAVGHVVDLQCEELPKPLKNMLIHNYYSVDMEGHVVQRQLSGVGFGDSKQTFLPMFPAPPTSMLSAMAVHPIKLTSEFAKFHSQIKYSLRPPLFSSDDAHASDGVDETEPGYKKFISRYSNWVDGSCVANVADQVCRMQDLLPPCYYRKTTSAEFPLEKVWIPTFHPEKIDEFLVPVLKPLGIEVEVFEALRGDAPVPDSWRGSDSSEPAVVGDEYRNLTKGEIGYRRSMEGIMRKFLEDSDAPLLFLCDDDVRFHVDFEKLYRELDSYCLDGLASGIGILKLQSAIWHTGTFAMKPGSQTDLNYERTLSKSAMYIGGWNLIDFEQSMTGSQCYSGHYAIMGSAATIYTRGSIPFVLQWLQDREVLPYDHVFSHLAHLGIPIRVTEPNLAIMELDKESSVDAERKASKWDIQAYARKVYALHRWQPNNYHLSIYGRRRLTEEGEWVPETGEGTQAQAVL